MVKALLPVECEGASLTYDFKNTRPIELVDFTSSLFSLGEQFRSFVARREAAHAADDMRLYVKEVRTGSIIAELISEATQQQWLAPAAPFIISYAQELGEWFEFFKGIKDAVDIKDLLLGTSKKDLQQLSNIIAPVAKDNGSQINFIAQNGGTIIMNAPLTSTEANAGQQRLRRIIDERPTSESGVKEDEVLYWYQVRDDQAKKPGDLGVIERYAMKPVKVRFASDQVKSTMIEMPDNPFKKLFVVDVDITFIGGRPVLYKVLATRDVLDKD